MSHTQDDKTGKHINCNKKVS